MLKRLIPYQLGQQPSGYHIFFDEIEMLGVGQFLRVKDGRVLVENENRRQYVSYSDALDAAVTAMREQVESDCFLHEQSGDSPFGRVRQSRGIWRDGPRRCFAALLVLDPSSTGR